MFLSREREWGGRERERERQAGRQTENKSLMHSPHTQRFLLGTPSAVSISYLPRSFKVWTAVSAVQSVLVTTHCAVPHCRGLVLGGLHTYTARTEQGERADRRRQRDTDRQTETERMTERGREKGLKNGREREDGMTGRDRRRNRE